MVVGVGVSDSFIGFFCDVLGRLLVENWGIDLIVWIDDDGQVYMYWGNLGLWYVKLNLDMVLYSGGINMVMLMMIGFGICFGNVEWLIMYEEGFWIYKWMGKYYMVFVVSCCLEYIGYLIGFGLIGFWIYGGVVMFIQGSSFINYLGVIDYQGLFYFFYYNGVLFGGGGYICFVCVEFFMYGVNGFIFVINMFKDGVFQVGNFNFYVCQEVEIIVWELGVQIELCSEGGMNVLFINNGDYIKVKGVVFGSGVKFFIVWVLFVILGGKIEVCLDSIGGMFVGICNVFGIGGWQIWINVNCVVGGVIGIRDFFFCFIGVGGELFWFNWWQFSQ